MKTLPQPCPSCPWRIDQGAKDIPNFDMKRAERLTATCPDARDMGPEFGAAIFSCHQSREGEDFPCAGWLAQVGNRHPSIRFAVMRGEVPLERLEPSDGWPALHENYPEVLEKLKATT